MKTILLFTILICGNFFQNSDTEIIKAKMREYDSYVAKKNSEAVANLYTEDAMYGDNVKGRKAIKEYLDTYRNINVITHHSVTTKLEIKGTLANHEGTYKQIVRSNDKLKEHTGTFRMVWVKLNNKWLISNMRVTSKRSR